MNLAKAAPANSPKTPAVAIAAKALSAGMSLCVKRYISFAVVLKKQCLHSRLHAGSPVVSGVHAMLFGSRTEFLSFIAQENVSAEVVCMIESRVQDSV